MRLTVSSNLSVSLSETSYASGSGFSSSPSKSTESKNELNDMKQNATQADAEINEGVEINKN